MSDTPRTDAALVDHMPETSEWSQCYLDLTIHARQLERELNAATAENEAMLDAVAVANYAICDLRLFASSECDMSLSNRALNKLKPFLK